MDDGDARKYGARLMTVQRVELTKSLSRYGDEIARLQTALAAVKQACEAARCSGVSKAVAHDAKVNCLSCYGTLTTDLLVLSHY